QILAIGDLVENDLQASDVRLTMGGELTFVSIDDMESPQWNTDALGDQKRILAVRLMRRLRERWAPGGCLHFAQGKWYPGESLPRWALGCFWRADGVPVWNDPLLFQAEDSNPGFTSTQARSFIEALADELRVTAEYIQPGLEDPWYYFWKERRLPSNVDPLDSRMKNPEERARMAKVFEQGLDSVVGYALPLRPSEGWGPGWESGKWLFRTDRMFLIPGDSPMGLRLPLDSLPWEAPIDGPTTLERDPFEPRTALPAQFQPSIRVIGGTASREVSSTPVSRVMRSALCVEARGGKMYIFLPPLGTLESALDLISAIERTALRLGMPVVLEGYPPPTDPRLLSFKVTPDPGVIEVNVPPVSSWKDLVKLTGELYEEARICRLGTEKFMLDGRHSGTGGGNHIVVGAAMPADSPFLRRPDLLRSLVGFWHNHPSLSYLFSSLFVGPTSQAPRVDEGRRDALYELDIAFSKVPETGPIPPWIVDRLFRHLLVDLTGNTHRSEFCIDKLFSPDSSSGRLGL
ncbi:MAG: transglutaminase family protein, partial [Terrimicrobiaceae bacterium]